MQHRDSILASATGRLSAGTRAATAIGIAFLFGVVVALSFSALMLPLLGYFGGYAGITVGLILFMVVAFGLTAYLAPTLYRKFQNTSAN